MALDYTTTDNANGWSHTADTNTTGSLDNAERYIQVATGWTKARVDLLKKRRRFLGRKEAKDSKKEAKAFFTLLKEGLKRAERKKFKKLANKAFEEALKCEKAGQEKVKKELEERLTFYLKKAAIQTKGYEKYVDMDMIERYREHLPNDKALVIDEISEYEKPIPKRAQKKLTTAREDKVFDEFWVFWIKRVPDPILFGTVKGEKDVYYFIDEWDDDVSIDDLMKHKK